MDGRARCSSGAALSAAHRADRVSLVAGVAALHGAPEQRGSQVARLHGEDGSPTLDPATPLYAASGPQLAAGGRDRVKALLGDGRAGTTVMLWCAFIASFTFIGQWSSWSTTVFKDILQMDWKSIAKMTSLYTSLGVIGASTIGFAIDRFGFRAVLPTTYALGICRRSRRRAHRIREARCSFACGDGSLSARLAGGTGGAGASLFPASHSATAVGWAYGSRPHRIDHRACNGLGAGPSARQPGRNVHRIRFASAVRVRSAAVSVQAGRAPADSCADACVKS